MALQQLYGKHKNSVSYSDGITLTTSYRETFFPELPVNEVPAHCFLKSIHNITIERGWSQLKLQFDANVDEFWDQGIIDGIYDMYDDRHM